MKRVAVTYSVDDKVAPYAEALREVGMEPVLVSPHSGVQSLNGIDGLLVTGGTDVNASVYGHTRDARSEDPDDERDAMEQRLMREALDRDLPLLAICRGMQLFNVIHPGGTLIQHIEGHTVRGPDLSAPAHPVEVEKGTALARILGAGSHPVNSRHHQAVMQPGAGLVVSARAEDGIIEAVERPDRSFAIAVQWHPENQVHAFPEQRRLFEAFRDAL